MRDTTVAIAEALNLVHHRKKSYFGTFSIGICTLSFSAYGNLNFITFHAFVTISITFSLAVHSYFIYLITFVTIDGKFE